MALPAMVLGNDGVERVDRAQEAHEDARVDARPQPHRGEVGGRSVTSQHGVDNSVEHHRHLADEERSRLGEDAPRYRRVQPQPRAGRAGARPGQRGTTWPTESR